MIRKAMNSFAGRLREVQASMIERASASDSSTQTHNQIAINTSCGSGAYLLMSAVAAALATPISVRAAYSEADGLSMSNPMNIFMNVEKSLSRLQANDIRLQLKFVPPISM